MNGINLIVKTRNWTIESHVNQHILHNHSVSKLGWQRVVVIAKNDQAERFIKQQGLTLLRQNENLQGVPIQHDDERKFSLVFYRHNPLKKITLDWILPQSVDALDDALFSVRIKPISAAKAWFFMLQAVAKKDKENGNRGSQIYRLTRARQKRSGGAHALRKLVQAYQPLLQHQLISCEPYKYWRLYNEPATRDALLAYYSAKAMPQVSEIPSHADAIKPTAWYFITRDGVVHTKQFMPLLQSAVRIAEQQQASVVYWDHDQFNEQDERLYPHFKPDWSPELFLASDYIGPCFAVKGALLQRVFKRWQQQQDHYQQFLLLLCEQPQLAITHIPVILQHHTPEIAQLSANSELESERQTALNQWLQSSGDVIPNYQTAVEFGVRKAVFPLTPAPTDTPQVSIIIPTRDALDITRNCVRSVLEKTTQVSYEILIVDNQSEQPQTLQWFTDIQQHANVRVIEYDAPFNYSAINNHAVHHARGALLCFLNNDTEVINSDWLSELVQQAQRPAIGCVGAKLYYPDNTIQHAGVILGLWGLAGHGHKNFTRNAPGYCNRLAALQNYSAVTAACLVVKKALFEQVGGFNETDLTVAFNDVDLCLKIKAAGYRNVWTPYAELYHYESKTRGKEDSPEKKARERGEINYMQTNWQHWLTRDPAYNPNLTRVQEDFGINLDPISALLPLEWQ